VVQKKFRRSTQRPERAREILTETVCSLQKKSGRLFKQEERERRERKGKIMMMHNVEDNSRMPLLLQAKNSIPPKKGEEIRKTTTVWN